MKCLAAVYSIVCVLLLGSWACFAQLPLSGAGGAGSGGVAYVGPGDVYGAAAAWWGLRGFSAAYAATGASAKAIDIVDSTGANPATILILATGALDTATLNTWIGLHGTASVPKLYDQSGSGLHMTQATLANMPTINTTGVINLRYNNSTYIISSTFTQHQPHTLNMVSYRVADTTGGAVSGLVANSTATGLRHMHGNTGNWRSNVWGLFSAIDLPLASPAAIQGFANGASSKLYTNGTLETGDAGAGDFTSDSIELYTNAVDFCAFTEGGLWAGDKSASFSSMNTNQHTYWGF